MDAQPTDIQLTVFSNTTGANRRIDVRMCVWNYAEIKVHRATKS